MTKKELALWDDLHYELRDAEYWAESKDWKQVKKRLSNAQDILHALEDLSHPEPEPDGKFVRPKILVKRCCHCGDVSIPYFGFFVPCHAHSLGSHQITEPFEEDDHGFDRAKFDKYASPEAKALLST